MKLSEDKKDAFLNYFMESEILGEEKHLEKALLYFNLPFDLIISKFIPPKRIFVYDAENERKTVS